MHPAVTIGISILILAGLGLLLWAPWSQQGIAKKELVFYCAAGMIEPIKEIVKQYEDEYDVKVHIDPDGTGKLLSKIKSVKGKGDLYLAADRKHMNEAQQEGFVAETIPIGHLQPVIAVKKSAQAKWKAEGKKTVSGVKDLLLPHVKVVIANPELAAVGLITKNVLSKKDIDLWDKLAKDMDSSTRVSTVSTVNKIITAVRSQDNTVGIVWRAVAKKHQDLDVIEMDEFRGQTEFMQIGILTKAKGEQATAALQFARYLTARDKGLPIFEKYHFNVITDGDKWSERPKLHLSSGAMLKPAIEDVVKAFEKREGVSIQTTYDGCGVLVTQMRAIKKGSRDEHFPDAYFSCDVTFLEMVQDWFDAARDVSENDMVMIVQKNNPKNIRNLEDLARKDVKVGLCHPDKSALGKLAEDLLKRVKLASKDNQSVYDLIFVDGWKDHVLKNSSAGHDLVNKVRLGSMDVAIVYRSNAMANADNINNRIKIVNIDVAGAFARQPYAVAKSSDHKYLMQRLFRAIVAEQTQDRFNTLGFKWVYDTE